MPKGVQFLYVYKSLAHPEWNHYVTPFTLEERLMHVAEAERTLGSSIPWVVDSMDNDVKGLFGGVPNCELVVDPEGKVVRRRGWSDPEALRQDLVELIGPVKTRTRVADLGIDVAGPAPGVARGIVPRIEMPSRMRALLIDPVLDDTKHPFFVKLRAEADQGVLRRGSGKMYLGFHLDPLYRVHWNNLSPPLTFEVVAPEGLTVTPAAATTPKVETEADADPREFLVEVSGASAETSFELRVKYYACADDDSFCVPVKQRYVVTLEGDPHGGSAIRGRRAEMMQRMQERRGARPPRRNR